MIFCFLLSRCSSTKLYKKMNEKQINKKTRNFHHGFAPFFGFACGVFAASVYILIFFIFCQFPTIMV